MKKNNNFIFTFFFKIDHQQLSVGRMKINIYEQNSDFNFLKLHGTVSITRATHADSQTLCTLSTECVVTLCSIMMLNYSLDWRSPTEIFQKTTNKEKYCQRINKN
jgi:hypothetical protein